MSSLRYRCETCDKPFDFEHSYGDWVPPQCPGCKFGDRKRSDRTDAMVETDTGDGIYTDGSCIGNPGPGGWAWVRIVGGKAVLEETGSDPATTNNRMEFQPVVAVMKTLRSGETVTIFIDSQLVVNTLNNWAEGWKARGWKRKGGAIKNLDLVKAAHALKQSHPGVKIAWVKGHAGNTWNEYADDLANAAANEARPDG